MLYDLVVYPDERINLLSSDVRYFDDELFRLIDDMKETAEHHGADGLAAIQIGFPTAVAVVKQPDGTYLELINPRIIKKSGSVEAVESTLYFPDTEHTVKRYETISLIYQDRHGEQHSLQAEGEFSRLLQRKCDYVFGGSFVSKLPPKERKKVAKGLAAAGQSGSFEQMSGPISKREYIKSMMNKLLFLQFLTLFAPLLGFEPETVSSFYTFDLYATAALLLLDAGYYGYAMYEARRVVSCTGCQVVNFVSVALQYLAAIAVMFGLSYWLLGS